jgi:phage terminase large subunit-like protein
MSVEEKVNFLTKHCNIFVNSADKWLDIMEVKANRVPGLDIEQFRGRKAWVGIDRAMVHDLTAFSVLIPDDVGGVDVFLIHLLPEKTVKAAGDYLKSVYVKAIESGDLRLVMSPTVRDDDIKKVMTEISLMFDVEAFCYDPYHMADIASDMENAGFTMLSVSQGTGNMSLPAKKLEGLIKEKQLRYDSGLFEFAASCALVTMTRQNNLMVYRENSKTDKIDGLIATIIALSAATLGEVKKNIYNERGLLMF